MKKKKRVSSKAVMDILLASDQVSVNINLDIPS